MDKKFSVWDINSKKYQVFNEYFIILEIIRQDASITYFIRINKKYLGMPLFYIIEK